MSPSAGTTQKAAILRRLAGAARALLAAIGQIGRCIFDENHGFLTFTAWQRISYEAQRIDCGVIAKIPHGHALCALSASTETGWIVSFLVSLKICRALKRVKRISCVAFSSG